MISTFRHNSLDLPLGSSNPAFGSNGGPIGGAQSITSLDLSSLLPLLYCLAAYFGGLARRGMCIDDVKNNMELDPFRGPKD